MMPNWMQATRHRTTTKFKVNRGTIERRRWIFRRVKWPTMEFSFGTATTCSSLCNTAHTHTHSRTHARSEIILYKQLIFNKNNDLADRIIEIRAHFSAPSNRPRPFYYYFIYIYILIHFSSALIDSLFVFRNSFLVYFIGCTHTRHSLALCHGPLLPACLPVCHIFFCFVSHFDRLCDIFFLSFN